MKKSNKKIKLHCIINDGEYSIPIDELKYRVEDMTPFHKKWLQMKPYKTAVVAYWDSWPFCIYVKESVEEVEAMLGKK